MSKKERDKKFIVKIDDCVRTIDKIVFDNSGIHVIDADTNNDSTVEVDYQTSYKRESGKDKIIHKVTDVEFSNFDIYSNDHVVCACDTNTTHKNESKLSTSAFLMGQITSEDDKKVEREFTMQIAHWESTGVEKPENYAWAVLISKLNKMFNDMNVEPRVLLIVDSDLEYHDVFNSGEKALIDDFFLPSNYTITYASADVGAEYPINKLIRLCDKEASKFHKEVLK